MAAVGITSPPAPSAFVSAASPSSNSSNSSNRIRLRYLPSRIAAAASADGSAQFSEGASAVAEIEGNPDAGTDVTGGAAASTRPPYSLISADNVQKAMRGLAITDADHYGRLGITKLASTDEVKAAYERRCEELNSRGLEEELNKEHNLLKESFTILSTDEERRLYDWSLSRSGQPERYVWPFQVDPLELAPDPEKGLLVRAHERADVVRRAEGFRVRAEKHEADLAAAKEEHRLQLQQLEADLQDASTRLKAAGANAQLLEQRCQERGEDVACLERDRDEVVAREGLLTKRLDAEIGLCEEAEKKVARLTELEAKLEETERATNSVMDLVYPEFGSAAPSPLLDRLRGVLGRLKTLPKDAAEECVKYTFGMLSTYFPKLSLEQAATGVAVGFNVEELPDLANKYTSAAKEIVDHLDL